MRPLVEASVIIPTYRRFQAILNTVNDLLSQEECQFEIIVIDQNDSWPDDLNSDRQTLLSDTRIRWINHFPKGVVKARNHAAGIASGDVLIFIDDDVQIHDSLFLSKHLQIHREHQFDLVTGAELYLSDDSIENFTLEKIDTATNDADWTEKSYLDQILNFPRSSVYRTKVCTFCTCNGSIRRSAFMKLNGFDEHFIGNSYGDDYDLAIRACRAGFRSFYSPAPWLIHLQLPMGGLRMKDHRNQTTEFEKTAAPMLFAVRHFEPKFTFSLLYGQLLRKTVLRRENLTRPWRQVIAWPAFVLCFLRAMIIEFGFSSNQISARLVRHQQLHE